MPRHAAIYARISSDRDELRLGVQRQLKDCRSLCEDEGLTIFSEYVDNDISAADLTKRRPQYELLTQDIKAGKVGVVVVANADRLHRRPAEVEEFLETAAANGLQTLLTSRGPIDLTDPNALLMFRLQGSMAAWEVSKMKERIKRKHLELAEAGKPNGGGTRPFGYEDDRITINKAEAKLIREAADHVLAEGSLRSIRTKWTEDKVPTVTGRPWSVTAIRTILTRPRTAGLRQRGGKDNWDPEWKAVWQPILDLETWTTVRNILTSPLRRQPPPSRIYPLRGVLRCGSCPRFLTAMPRGGGRNYGCRKEAGGCGHVFISANHVEQFVFALLLPLADSPELRDSIHDEEADQKLLSDQLVQSIRRDEASLDKLQDDHYINNLIGDRHFERISKRLTKKIDEQYEQLSAFRGHSALDRLGGQVQNNWDEMSVEDQRLIIQSLVTEIKVYPVKHRGSNIFDPSRLQIVFRYESLAKVTKPWLDQNGTYRIWGTVKVDRKGQTHGFE